MTAPLTPPAGSALASHVGLVGRMQIRNKRYHDGTRYWSRVSTLLKNIETDTFQLEQWKKRQVARGLAKRPDLVLAVAAAEQADERNKLTKDARSVIDDLCEQAMEASKSSAGATAGTAMHTATERVDLGETVNLPYPYSVDLAAYQTLVKAMGLTFKREHIERSVRNDRTDNVGTIDRAGTSALLEQRGILAPGEQIIIDVKTEGAPLLNLMHIAAQLAEYAHADAMWIPAPTPENSYDGVWESMPQVSRAVGLMIHIRDGRATPYLLDLTAGWRQCLRAVEQREQLKLSKIELGNPGCWAQIVPVDLPPATEVVTQAHERERAIAELRAQGHPQHVIDAGGPDHYAAGLSQSLGDVIARNDIAGLHMLLADRYLSADDAALGRAAMDRLALAYDGNGHVTVPASASNRPASVAAEAYGVGDTVTVGGVQFTKHAEWPGAVDLNSMLLEQIAVADSAQRLGELWQLGYDNGIAWPEAAGDARGRIVNCPQRTMHDPSMCAKCACGWTRGLHP